MRKYIDLHTHSTRSDGSFSPSELILYADKLGLYAVALTDHDNIDGHIEAYETAKNLEIKFIPGIELSCDFESELHIVGLNIDYTNKDLISACEKFKDDRKKRNISKIKKLNDIGLDINLEDVKKYCPGDAIGRPHIAKALVDKGYAIDVKDAFKKYLGKGKVGYSNEYRISYEEAISLIKNSGGTAILAHCHSLNMDNETFISFVKKLKEAGLDGLEGYYTQYTEEQSAFYKEVAKKLDLKISGGSDFHGNMKPLVQLGTGFGNLKIEKELLEKLI